MILSHLNQRFGLSGGVAITEADKYIYIHIGSAPPFLRKLLLLKIRTEDMVLVLQQPRGPTLTFFAE